MGWNIYPKQYELNPEVGSNFFKDRMDLLERLCPEKPMIVGEFGFLSEEATASSNLLMPPMQEGGLSDDELLRRMKAVHSEVAKRLAELRKAGRDATARELHESITFRMHDLGEFMKALLQRYWRWPAHPFDTSHGQHEIGPGDA